MASEIPFRRRFHSQEQILEQERVRLDALRKREEDRVKRFMNAKKRSIGIDKSYLDKQVEEKRLLELAQKENRLVEGEWRRSIWKRTDNEHVKLSHSFPSY